MTRPFVKWAGGKSQLLDRLIPKVPAQYERYVELMLGGGAFFWRLNPNSAILNDANSELINLYTQVKENVEGLITELGSLTVNADTYYGLRNADREPSFAEWSLLRRAARTLYLNKLGFNGLYRVNKDGLFNVPFNKKTGIDFDFENLRQCSAALNKPGVTLRCGDYHALLPDLSATDFVYIDPPYLPLNNTSKFTEYTSAGFDLAEHRKLKEFCDALNERGIKFMLSNSHTTPILELFSQYNITVLFARRSINSNGGRRGQIPEIVVTNYGH
mgnify:CR=1 FL=1